MLALAIAIAFLVATSSARINNDDQQVFNDRQTTFLTVTTTQHITSHVTIYDEPTTTSRVSPPTVQTWYGGQKETGCDKTACASCRYWYKCDAGDRACITCDNAPYCAACLETTWSGVPAVASATPAPVSSPTYNPDAELDPQDAFRAKVALSALQDAEIYEHDAFRAKVVLSALAFFPDRQSLETAVGSHAASRLCSLGDGKAPVLCYSKNDMRSWET